MGAGAGLRRRGVTSRCPRTTLRALLSGARPTPSTTRSAGPRAACRPWHGLLPSSHPRARHVKPIRRARRRREGAQGPVAKSTRGDILLEGVNSAHQCPYLPPLPAVPPPPPALPYALALALFCLSELQVLSYIDLNITDLLPARHPPSHPSIPPLNPSALSISLGQAERAGPQRGGDGGVLRDGVVGRLLRF